MPIRFRCPTCQQVLGISSRKAGSQVSCPKCAAPVTVPREATIQAAAALPAALPVRPAVPVGPATADGSSAPLIVFLGGAAAALLILLLTGVAVTVIVFGSGRGMPAAPGGGAVAQTEKPRGVDDLPLADPQKEKRFPDRPPETGTEGKSEKGPTPPADFPKDPPEPKELPAKGKKGGGRIMSLDKFGNPEGDDIGLAVGGDFKGKRILVWWYPNFEDIYLFAPGHPLWESLRKKGFVVQLEKGRFHREWLDGADQFWLFASTGPGHFTLDDLGAVEKFARGGKGLYLLADNDPYTYEVSFLATRLFGSTVRGNYSGQQIAYVKERSLTRDQIRKYRGQFGINDHPLLTGVNFIYEGVTVSHFEETKDLELVFRASDGRPMVAVSRLAGTRIVLDCGFTRYFSNLIGETAGTQRFGENVAAYLAGAGRAPRRNTP